MEDIIRNLFSKKIFIIVIVFILLASIVIFFIFYFSKIYQGPEERENEAIKSGLMKMLGGKIAEVDNNQKLFIIDIDPLGKHKLYNINTEEKTNFSVTTYFVPEMEKGNIFSEENIIKSLKLEQKLVDFNYLKTGMEVQVFFSKRIDVDKAKNLTAESVNIIEESGVLENE